MAFHPTPEQIEAARAHAAAVAPLESCGLIYNGEYRAVRNTVTKPGAFSMDPREVHNLKTCGNIQAVVHSHVNVAPIASEADRSNCERNGLPWLIINHPIGTWSVIEPCGWRAPLVGREWAWGTQDCWGLVRDAYQDYAGLTLPDYEREWEWWKKGGDIIVDQFADSGFVRLPTGSPWQHLDVAGMQIGAKVVNHLGVYLRIWPNPDAILHQLAERLSVRQTFGGLFQNATTHHFRHEKFLTSAPETISDGPPRAKVEA